MEMEAYIQQLPDLARRLKALEAGSKRTATPSPKKKKR
jgi:hypothetical protein